MNIIKEFKRWDVTFINNAKALASYNNDRSYSDVSSNLNVTIQRKLFDGVKVWYLAFRLLLKKLRIDIEKY